MSMINKEIGGFSAQAYVNNSFRTVTKEDVLGKWTVANHRPNGYEHEGEERPKMTFSSTVLLFPDQSLVCWINLRAFRGEVPP